MIIFYELQLPAFYSEESVAYKKKTMIKISICVICIMAWAEKNGCFVSAQNQYKIY